MPKRWLAEPLAALADIEVAAGNRSEAIELAHRALDALTDEKGSDIVALREYITSQLVEWQQKR
jgi:hypothetical protein